MAEPNGNNDQTSGPRGLVDRARSSAADQLNTQKSRATDGIGSVAQAIRQSTQQLRDQKHETIAGYVEQAADQLDKFSKQLRDKDVTEMLSDAQRFARRQPAMFVGAAFAVGLLGARFLKSSKENRWDDEDDGSRYASYGSRYARRYSAGPNVSTAADRPSARPGATGGEFATGSGAGTSASTTTGAGITSGSSTDAATGASSTRARTSASQTGASTAGSARGRKPQTERS
jgi:hypothetical protein